MRLITVQCLDFMKRCRLQGLLNRKNWLPAPTGSVTVNCPLALLIELVTGDQMIGGVRLAVKYNSQSLAQPGQLRMKEPAVTLNPSAG